MQPIQATEPSPLESALLNRQGAPPPQAGLISLLDQLAAFSDALAMRPTQRDLEAARRRLQEDRFHLVLLGEFKRGKSTLVNALLERDLLPTGVIPLTSVVTVLTFGQHERLLICFGDGREEERPLDDLAELVTETGNPENRLGVELVRVELEHELLGMGLDIVDTPGIGSIHTHNTQATLDFLAQVDAAVFVLDAGQPFTQAERDLALEAAQRVPQVLLVVNKIDQLALEDRETALEFIERAAGELLGDVARRTFAVSAREGEGMVALRRRMRKLAGDERTETQTRSLAGIVSAAAAEVAQTARLEMRATELPLVELQRRVQTFNARIAELRTASTEAATLLEQGVRRALGELLNRPLESYAGAEADRLSAALRIHGRRLGRVPPRQLATELDAWIDMTVREDFAALQGELESALADELAGLERGYTLRIDRILADIQRVASDVFDADAGALLPDVGLREPSRFSFKLEDPEHALDMIVARLRTMLPGPLGRRLLLDDAQRRLLEMTDRHAGRLRSELHQRALTATRGYQRELTASVEAAIAKIATALNRAVDQRTREEATIQVRLAELAQIVEHCELACE